MVSRFVRYSDFQQRSVGNNEGYLLPVPIRQNINSYHRSMRDDKSGNGSKPKSGMPMMRATAYT